MGLGLVHTFKVGTTQVGLDFNSLCKLDDGTVLGANSDGIYILDSAQDDDGVDIDAFCEFVRTDFGLSQQKRIRKVIVSFEADGNQVLSFRDDEGNWIERVLQPFTDSQKSEGMVAPVGRALSGRHFTVKWANQGGSDFSIDAIDCMLTLRQKRAGRSLYFRPWAVVEFPVIMVLAGDGTLMDFTTWDDWWAPSSAVTIEPWTITVDEMQYGTDIYWEYNYDFVNSKSVFEVRFLLTLSKLIGSSVGIYFSNASLEGPFLDIYYTGGEPIIRLSEYIAADPPQKNSDEYALE